MNLRSLAMRSTLTVAVAALPLGAVALAGPAAAATTEPGTATTATAGQALPQSGAVPWVVTALPTVVPQPPSTIVWQTPPKG